MYTQNLERETQAGAEQNADAVKLLRKKIQSATRYQKSIAMENEANKAVQKAARSIVRRSHIAIHLNA
jgi:hypothetical protein